MARSGFSRSLSERASNEPPSWSGRLKYIALEPITQYVPDIRPCVARLSFPLLLFPSCRMTDCSHRRPPFHLSGLPGGGLRTNISVIETGVTL